MIRWESELGSTFHGIGIGIALHKYHWGWNRNGIEPIFPGMELESELNWTSLARNWIGIDFCRDCTSLAQPFEAHSEATIKSWSIPSAKAAYYRYIHCTPLIPWIVDLSQAFLVRLVCVSVHPSFGQIPYLNTGNYGKPRHHCGELRKSMVNHSQVWKHEFYPTTVSKLPDGIENVNGQSFVILCTVAMIPWYTIGRNRPMMDGLLWETSIQGFR